MIKGSCCWSFTFLAVTPVHTLPGFQPACFQHNGARGDDAAVAIRAIVHHYGAYPGQHVIFNNAAIGLIALSDASHYLPSLHSCW